MDKEKTKVAIIGLGKMGQNHQKTVVSNPDTQLIATVDPYNTGATHKTIQEMLDDVTPHCAIISTPTAKHLVSAVPLMEEGIHLLIEKPVVSSLEEIEKIRKFSKRNNTRIAVGHVERFNPAIQSLKKEIENDTIIDCYSKRVGPYPKRIGDVGVTLDLAVHDIDLIRFITGKNILECAGHKKYIFNKTKEDNITILLGVGESMPTISSVINVSWTHPHRERRMQILTRESFYTVDMMNLTVEKYQRGDSSKYSVENLYVMRGDALQNQLKSFLRYIIMDENNHIATLEDGIESLRVAWEAKR